MFFAAFSRDSVEMGLLAVEPAVMTVLLCNLGVNSKGYLQRFIDSKLIYSDNQDFSKIQDFNKIVWYISYSISHFTINKTLMILYAIEDLIKYAQYNMFRLKTNTS